MRVRHIPPNLVRVRHEKLVRVRHVPPGKRKTISTLRFSAGGSEVLLQGATFERHSRA